MQYFCVCDFGIHVTVIKYQICHCPQELKYREELVPVDMINRSAGISESADSIAKLLTRMCLKSEVADNGSHVKIEVPPTRAGV